MYNLSSHFKIEIMETLIYSDISSIIVNILIE